MRKRFSNITGEEIFVSVWTTILVLITILKLCSGPIKEDEPLNEIMESTDISLVDLETYYKTHSSEIHKQFSVGVDIHERLNESERTLTAVHFTQGAPKHTSGECKYGANVELKPKNRFKNILPCTVIVLSFSDEVLYHNEL